MRILVSWIGHTDFRSLLKNDPSGKIAKLLTSLNIRNLDDIPEDEGPVKTILRHQEFDAVHLLSNTPKLCKEHKQVVDLYLKSLRPLSPSVTSESLNPPTDYRRIFNITNAFLASIAEQYKKKDYELNILLSSGTPAMAANWVLLSKAKYPARYWHCWKDVATEEEIPFDITVELISQTDILHQHLIARSPEDVEGFEGIVGKSTAIRRATGLAAKAAAHDISVLLTGESGTGKELFARAIHQSSKRKEKPFRAINCAAIPKELFESELFGHKKGSFTGATSNRDGEFKLADGGTLFLDEIGECDLAMQTKLLRVLQPPLASPPCTREFQPVGGSKPIRTDVRIIAATNRNILTMVEENQFRDDLFYRFASVTIQLPPLRERKKDIVPIAEALLQQINNQFSAGQRSYQDKKLSQKVKTFLHKQEWHGNVRQLYNALLQAVVMSDGPNIKEADILAATASFPGKSRSFSDFDTPIGEGFDLEKHLDRIRERYLLHALEEAGGKKTKAAQLLGLNNYQTLTNQMEKLGIAYDK